MEFLILKVSLVDSSSTIHFKLREHILYFANVEYLVIFQGTELEFSGLAIEFRVDTAKTTYCQVFTFY